MKKLYDKAPVLVGIVCAVVITALFYVVEWIIWKYTNLCNGDQWHYYDFAIRMAFGFIGLFVLKIIYGKDLKKIFTGKITKQVWRFMIPIFVYFLLVISELFLAKEITTAYTVSFLIAWLTQIGSGFFEEIVSRGVLMSGLISKYKSSVKGRLLIVGITGLVFGLEHLMNFIYGNDIIDCLFWGLDTMMWGMFIAALYLMTENLWLVIIIHAVWDIIVRIPNYYIVSVENVNVYNGIIFMEEYVMNGVFLICAVLICIFGFKTRRKEAKE